MNKINFLDEMIEKYKTPLQLYDEDKIVEQINKLKHAFSNDFNFKNFFAVKSTPNINILKIMIENGFGLDCSSINEIKLGQLANCKKEDIIFTGNYISTYDYYYILDKNILINLDDYEILHRVDKFPEEICFRLNPNLDLQTDVKSNLLSGSESKFGIAECDIIDAYKLAKSKNVKKFGIHVMIGSNMIDENYWKLISDKVHNIVFKLKNQLDINISFINLGGGFGIPYKPNQEELDLKKINNILKKSIEENSKLYNMNITKNLYFECGRYVTAQAGYLIAQLVSIKESNNKTFYGLNSCMSNLMRTGMYNAYHKIDVLNNNNNNKIVANIVGQLCENNDWFAKDRLIQKSNINDIFIIYDTGAHGHSMGFQYNARLRAPEVLFNKSDYRLIRERETFKLYIQNMII